MYDSFPSYKSGSNEYKGHLQALKLVWIKLLALLFLCILIGGSKGIYCDIFHVNSNIRLTRNASRLAPPRRDV